MDFKTQETVEIDGMGCIKCEETEIDAVSVIKSERTTEIDTVDVIKSENLSNEEKMSSESTIEIEDDVESGNAVEQEPECDELKLGQYFILELNNQKVVTEMEDEPLTGPLRSEDGEIQNEIEVKVENDVLNSNVEKLADWKELKTNPDEVVFAGVSPARSSSKRSDSSKRSMRDVELSPVPFKKMKVAEGCICSVVKSETSPEETLDGGMLNEIGIKVEDDVEIGNSNDERTECVEVKTEPSEIMYSDPAQNVEINLEDGQIRNEFKVSVDHFIEDGVTSIEGRAGRVELNGDVMTTSEPSHSRSTLIEDAPEPVLESAPMNPKLTPDEPSPSPHVRSPSLEQCGFDRLTEQIIAFRRMSQVEAKGVSKKILNTLLDWIFNGCQRAKLESYEIRLKVAKVARCMDLAGFLPDDEWFAHFKNQLPQDFFVEPRPIRCNETLVRLGDNAGAGDPQNNSKPEIFKKLAEWYHKEPPALVSPGQVERSAHDIAKGMGVEKFYLSKNDMLLFVLQQGLYCNVNGKVSRIMKVKDGILSLIFIATFEIWYHEWPKSTHDLLQLKVTWHIPKEMGWAMLKGYIAILLDILVDEVYLNYFEGKPTRPPSCSISVTRAERRIAEAMFGRKLHRDICRLYSNKLKTEIRTIQSFNYAFGKKYCYRSYTFCSDHLKKNAEEVALTMGIGLSNVEINKNWLRRFAELTVACCMTTNKSHSHPKDLNNYFPLSSKDFDSAFELWYANGCPKDVVAYSCISSGNMEPYNPAKNPCPTTAKGNHIAEVDNWYKEHCVKGFVKSYELQEKAEEIARVMGLWSFVADKVWLKQCLMRNGLRYYYQRDGLITFSKPRSCYDPEFSKLFDKWCHEGFCKKCSKRVGHQNKSAVEKVGTRCSELDSDVHDWYVRLRYPVEPGVLEKKAAEIAKTLHNRTLPKRWVEDFIEQNGLYTEDGKFFFYSSFELIKSKFLCEFEIWYHQWPLTLEQSIVKETVTKTNFELYKQSILDWYMRSQYGKISCQDIETKSMSIIKKKIPGVTPQDVEVWTKRWCRQCNDVVRKIRGFDYAMRVWYFENRKARFVKVEELRMEAEQCAKKRVGFANFVATDVWLKRFVERYGVYTISGGVPKFLDASDVLQYDLDELFTVWCKFDGTDGPKMSSLAESAVLSEPSSSDIDSSSLEDIKVMSMSVDDDQEPKRSAFEAEVVLWYWKTSSKYEVSPGAYLEKVLGIRLDLAAYKGLVFGAGQRKSCIKKLVLIHGLQISSPWFSKNIQLVPADCSILKCRFDLAFEIWYYTYPLQVEDVKPEDCPLVGANLNLIKLYLTALQVWYVNLRQTDGQTTVSPEEIRVKEIEIANKLAPSEEKRALIARWCRSWCSESVAWIERIVRFDSELSSWYTSRKYLVKPNGLKAKAAKTANMLGIKDFAVDQKWMRRFVQLHGLRFMHNGVLKEFPGFADGFVSRKWPEFVRYYNDWLETDKKTCYSQDMCGSKDVTEKL